MNDSMKFEFRDFPLTRLPLRISGQTFHKQIFMIRITCDRFIVLIMYHGSMVSVQCNLCGIPSSQLQAKLEQVSLFYHAAFLP